MADIGYVESELGGMDKDTKKGVVSALRYILNNLTLGAPEDRKRSKNFQWYWYEVTTSSVANQEFSFAHGLGRTPTALIPVLPLGTAGTKIVNLEVSQVADDARVYLKSPSTSVPLVVLVE